MGAISSIYRGSAASVRFCLLSIVLLCAFGAFAASARADGSGLLSTGDGFTCGVDANGAAKCWGFGGDGELGNNHYDESTTPVQVSGLTSGVTAISAGDGHGCAVVNGGAMCWGNNGSGELGDGNEMPSNVPVAVKNLTSGVTAITAGDDYSCAIVNGGAWCWGDGAFGELGNGDPGNADSDVPVQVSGLTSGVTAISAGSVHTCAIVSGAAKCWGRNDWGELGNSDDTYTNSSVPVPVTDLTSGVTAISTGNDFSCAVASGAAKCWGYGENGELGDGNISSSNTPVDVEDLSAGVTAVAAGDSHACAIVSGAVKCWGLNDDGELGDGTGAFSGNPVPVSGLTSGVSAIAAGAGTSCAIVGATVKCWGNNFVGQVGNGAGNGSSNTPVQVSGLTANVTKISAGKYASCAIVDNAAKCWGYNGDGELGDGTYISSNTPVQVSGLTGLTDHVTAISVGGDHSCAIVKGVAEYGSAVCWGSNYYGELGNGTNTDSNTPVPVTGLSSNVIAISAGDDFTCAVVYTSSPETECWGVGSDGELGNGLGTSSNVPVVATGLEASSTTVSAGNAFACAINDGGAQCWGYGSDGELGNSANDSKNVPVPVTNLDSGLGFSIATGASHACAQVGHAAQCWGANGYGQLGNNSTTDSNEPVAVNGLASGVDQVAAGDNTSCAAVDGTAECWGEGDDGELGTGTNSYSDTPVQVTGLTNDTAYISVGYDHACAVYDGAAKCWGLGYDGQLGDGVFGYFRTPQAVTGFVPWAGGTPPSGGSSTPPPPTPAGPPAPTKPHIKLKPSGKVKVHGSHVIFTAKLDLPIPPGFLVVQACTGHLTATTKVKHEKKTKAKAKFKQSGDNCVASFKFKFHKKDKRYVKKGKKLKITVSFSGNAAFAKFKKSVHYRVK